MKSLILLGLVCLLSLHTVGQDSVFIRHSEDWAADTLNYVTDTVVFPSGMMRHILTGTTVLPSTHNQMRARGYGLYLDAVSKSDCQGDGEEAYHSEDKINVIQNTDSSLSVDITIYDNCCYDFLCDITVDEEGTLNLIYQGYGSYCACECCYGLVFHISKLEHEDYSDVKAVMLSGLKSTKRKLR